MKSKNYLIIGLGLLIFSCKKQNITLDVSDKASILKIIEAEKATQNISAISFCVVKGDNLIWSDALGEANKSIPTKATTDTRFIIASISKSITAVAAMKLAENKLLDLDSDINTYLPFEVKNPSFPTMKITTRMLLNHTSSISDAKYGKYDFYCWNEDCAVPLGSFLKDFYDSKGQFYSNDNFHGYQPGAQAMYSNMGFALLGYIIERIAKKPFDEYCKQNIFLPLGMTKTEWRLKNVPLNELAVPYSPASYTSSTPHYTFPDYPNGGLRTTPTDLSKFMRMLINNGTHNKAQILSPQTINLMRQRTSSITSPIGTLNFGLGLYYFNFKDKELYGHGGNELGTSTEMCFDATSKVGIVVFTNTSNPNLDLIINSLYKYGIAQ